MYFDSHYKLSSTNFEMALPHLMPTLKKTHHMDRRGSQGTLVGMFPSGIKYHKISAFSKELFIDARKQVDASPRSDVHQSPHVCVLPLRSLRNTISWHVLGTIHIHGQRGLFVLLPNLKMQLAFISIFCAHGHTFQHTTNNLCMNG